MSQERSCWLGALCPQNLLRLLLQRLIKPAVADDVVAPRADIVDRPCVWGNTKTVNYSRFDDVEDSEDDGDANPDSNRFREEDIAVPKEEVFSECRNCAKEICKVVEQLRCSKCQKAVYCSALCQKEDWKFHRRICTEACEEDRAKKKVDHEANKIGRLAAEQEFRRMKMEEFQRITGRPGRC
eukprot:TRINITY_DN66419_c0_g1_i1.p1 TRINITY_DN66419_c0_g1~~TRINITY_DN66419_c0_g1_i1.p1  ORF type:complete len:183 (-),score=39.08 TRINITY_DN66419_c0_g1_i1:76-624(-)